MIRYVALLPALVHIYIFCLESLWWGKKRTNEVFGVDAQHVEVLRPWAYNQGWYNLFLAGAVASGVVWGGLGGTVLAGYGVISMILASLVLVLSAPSKAKSAAVQGVPAVLGLLALIFA